MLEDAPLQERSLQDFKNIVGKNKVERIKKMGQKVNGSKILHLNSTYDGGGVAEILSNMIPLMRDLGIDIDWKVFQANEDFFDVTKEFHNALQGKDSELTPEMKQTYLEHNRKIGQSLSQEYDLMFIHDPQPLAAIDYANTNGSKWLWRCHIDLSNPNQQFYKFLEPYINQYHGQIYTLPDYVRGSNRKDNIFTIHPSIDPFCEKNKNLSEKKARSIVNRYDVDINRPIITQVSRFDPWKDPLGVIEAFRKVKKKKEDVQLVLVGGLASDDPEGKRVYEKVMKEAEGDKDINIYSNLSDLEVNAFQTASDIILQKSIREGFGLTVTEGLWKGSPVIGGKVGGIPTQIKNEDLLTQSIDETAQKILHLLENEEKRDKLGEKGKEWVRDNFLITRHILDYFNVMKQIEILYH